MNEWMRMCAWMNGMNKDQIQYRRQAGTKLRVIERMKG